MRDAKGTFARREGDIRNWGEIGVSRECPLWFDLYPYLRKARRGNDLGDSDQVYQFGPMGLEDNTLRGSDVGTLGLVGKDQPFGGGGARVPFGRVLAPSKGSV